MAKIGSVYTPVARKALLLGSGELGKEVAIELMRMGVEVVACDRYDNAPAMQVAHRSHMLNMLDNKALRSVIEDEKPDHIIPEVEAIATPELDSPLHPIALRQPKRNILRLCRPSESHVW